MNLRCGYASFQVQQKLEKTVTASLAGFWRPGLVICSGLMCSSCFHGTDNYDQSTKPAPARLGNYCRPVLCNSCFSLPAARLKVLACENSNKLPGQLTLVWPDCQEVSLAGAGMIEQLAVKLFVKMKVEVLILEMLMELVRRRLSGQATTPATPPRASPAAYTCMRKLCRVTSHLDWGTHKLY